MAACTSSASFRPDCDILSHLITGFFFRLSNVARIVFVWLEMTEGGECVGEGRYIGGC